MSMPLRARSRALWLRQPRQAFVVVSLDSSAHTVIEAARSALIIRNYCPGHRPGVYGTPAASSCCSNLRSSPSSARSFAASAFSSSMATV
jgi:hypothetical protein